MNCGESEKLYTQGYSGHTQLIQHGIEAKCPFTLGVKNAIFLYSEQMHIFLIFIMCCIIQQMKVMFHEGEKLNFNFSICIM